jgi:hypothetical protein
MNKDAEILLASGNTLLAAHKCGCERCVAIIDSVDQNFVLVATRFAGLAHKNPGLMFTILIEEWDRNKIIENIPELYS